MAVAYYAHSARRTRRRLRGDDLLVIVLGVLIAVFLGFVGNEVFNPDRIAEKAMLSNTRTFGVMCPTPGMTADQMVLWHAYAARKGLSAYPEAGPNCYDP